MKNMKLLFLFLLAPTFSYSGETKSFLCPQTITVRSEVVSKHSQDLKISSSERKILLKEIYLFSGDPAKRALLRPSAFESKVSFYNLNAVKPVFASCGYGEVALRVDIGIPKKCEAGESVIRCEY